jgi:8-oxo-dGTP pyrophosphatase MutT (NUDIX family)
MANKQLSKKQMYCVGFMFCNGHVLLVKKNRPDWQEGLWNGVGGSCYLSVLETATPAEHPHAAMPREFQEETGIVTTREDWTHFVTEVGSDYLLYCYKAEIGLVDFQLPRVPATNDVDEGLTWWDANIFITPGIARMVGNLRWMIPLAMDWRRLRTEPVFMFGDDIRDKPTW